MLEKFSMVLFGGIMAEVKAHPYTTLLALFAFGLASSVMVTQAPANELVAVKASLARTEKQLQKIIVGQVEAKIIIARVEFCRAQASTDPEAAARRTFLAAKVREHVNEYYDLTQRAYALPPCGEL